MILHYITLYTHTLYILNVLNCKFIITNVE